MNPDEQTVAGEGDEEELHHDRLMALLHDLVRSMAVAGALRGCWGSTGGPWPRAWTAEGYRGG